MASALPTTTVDVLFFSIPTPTIAINNTKDIVSKPEVANICRWKKVAARIIATGN